MFFGRFFACLFLAFLLTDCHKHKYHFSGYSDTLYVYLASPRLGFVQEKRVERGQAVQQGEILFRLSPEPEQFQAEAALDRFLQETHTLKDLKLPRRSPEIMAIENQILQTQAAMKRVSLHLNRLLKLEKKHFIDPDTIDNQTQTLKELSYQEKQFQENLSLAKMGARPQQIKAQMNAKKAAKAEWKTAVWYHAQKTLRAPRAGYVFDTFYSVGELVAAEKPVLVMVVPDNNYIEFFVSAKDLSRLRLGQSLEYQFYGDKVHHPAHIHYISATAEYMPPVLYTPEYQEELVYRVRAKPKDSQHFLLGQPLDIWL